MTKPHNRLHVFHAGVNSLNNTAPLLFDHPTQQGWKVYEETLNESAVRIDDAYWDINANGAGTFVAGDENSISIVGDGSTYSGYSILRDFADVELTSSIKRFYLETRIKYTNDTGGSASANGWFIGWSSDNEAMTTGAVDALDVGNELLGFGHVDEATEVSFYSGAGGTYQTIGLGSNLVSGAYTKLACYYDGGRFNLYNNDALLSSTAKTQLNTSAPMLFQVFFEAVEAKANTFDVQYAILAVEL